MIKQLLSQFGYGIFAEAALIAFAIIFVSIVVHTLLSSTESMNEQANIPLETDHQS